MRRFMSPPPPLESRQLLELRPADEEEDEYDEPVILGARKSRIVRRRERRVR